MKPRALVSVLAFAAAGVVGWGFFLLDRRSQAEQLLEILAGESVPNAAWAFERLKDVGDEDLRDLVRHVDDASVTPLGEVFDPREIDGGPESALTLRRIARMVLISRTFPDNHDADDQSRPDDDPKRV